MLNANVREAWIFSLVEPGKNGRVSRLVETLLASNWRVTVVGPFEPSQTGDLSLVPLWNNILPFGLTLPARRFLSRLVILGGLLVGNSPQAARSAGDLLLGMKHQRGGLRRFSGPIFVVDILLAPSLLAVASNNRTVLDLRDLSHRLFEQSWVWRSTFGLALTRMMADSLPQFSVVYTVSNGLARVVEEDFGVVASVIRSIPSNRQCPPASEPPQRPLRMVYMGRADNNRRLDILIEACRELGEEIHLDLFVVGHRRDILKLRQAAKDVGHIRFLAPVPFKEIVPTMSGYDLGYAASSPTTKNHIEALPNKLFEYISAGVPVIVNPHSERARLVEELSCGIPINVEDVKALRDGLRNIGTDWFVALRRGVTRAQRTLTWEQEQGKLLALIKKLDQA